MAEQITVADYELEKAKLELLEKQLKEQGTVIIGPGAKPLYKSKIFWANVVAVGVMVANQVFGVELSAEELAVVLGAVFPLINIFLRFNGNDITSLT
jgi:hypothetical protein